MRGCGGGAPSGGYGGAPMAMAAPAAGGYGGGAPSAGGYGAPAPMTGGY